jgi:hypothetical protein
MRKCHFETTPIVPMAGYSRHHLDEAMYDVEHDIGHTGIRRAFANVYFPPAPNRSREDHTLGQVRFRYRMYDNCCGSMTVFSPQVALSSSGYYEPCGLNRGMANKVELDQPRKVINVKEIMGNTLYSRMFFSDPDVHHENLMEDYLWTCMVHGIGAAMAGAQRKGAILLDKPRGRISQKLVPAIQNLYGVTTRSRRNYFIPERLVETTTIKESQGALRYHGKTYLKFKRGRLNIKLVDTSHPSTGGGYSLHLYTLNRALANGEDYCTNLDKIFQVRKQYPRYVSEIDKVISSTYLRGAPCGTWANP